MSASYTLSPAPSNMTGSPSKQRPQLECTTPTQRNTSPHAGVSCSRPGQQRGIEAKEKIQAGCGNQPQHEVSSSGSTTDIPLGENDERVITNIRTTDIALGLGRIPAGIYAAVQHSGLGWRTDIKRLSVDDDAVEWNGHIPIPSDLSAIVCFGIYASFELQPILGDGERVRKLAVTVEQLLDHSAKELVFSISSDDSHGDIVSPRSSLSVSVGRWKRDGIGSPASRVPDPHRSTTEHQSQLEDATNQGHIALSRYIKYGNKRDLESSIEQFELALNVCPSEHPCRAAVQSNMAMAKFLYCQVDDTNQPLDVPLTLYQNALVARPVGHLDRPSTLIQLAIVQFARSQMGDAARAEELLHEVMKITSGDSHENRAAICILQLHAQHRTGPVQVGAQLSVERTSTSVVPNEDLWSLGDHLLDRFGQTGDLDSLRQAVSLLKASAWYTPAPSHRYRTRLTSLGTALLQRFRYVGELPDLEQATSRFRDAVDVTPDGHPDRPSCLCNLANSFKASFDRFGELGDLEQAITRQGDAVDLFPDGHPNKIACFSNLGNNFLTRFRRLGEQSDLERAISNLRNAVDHTPDTHPHKSTFLSNLGIALFTRFEYLGERSDLEQAILSHRNAVACTPDGHANKFTFLKNLGDAFSARFEHFEEPSDLQQAISIHMGAVTLAPDGHFQKVKCLTSLGNSFLTRFECLGELSDLEEAISRHKAADDLLPDGHPDKFTCLHNLGNTFFIRFELLGELPDLEQAISKFGDATDLAPRGHPDKPSCLSHLGTAFTARFERLGDPDDLDQAISRHKDAVDLIPDGHLHKLACLINLGNTFHARFEHLGDIDDLEQALSTQKAAIALAPDSHPHKVSCLMNLGIAFKVRFERLGEISDLEQAISMNNEVLRLTPNDLRHKIACLDSLGNTFLTRFKHFGGWSDLEQAIAMYRDAIDLVPDGQPDKPRYLTHLGDAFLTSFEYVGDLSDLEEAISRHREAVQLTPDDHPDKPLYLSSLGASFRVRFERLGELGDLEQAISKHGKAVGLTPNSHPRKFIHLNNLGNALVARFKCLGELDDLKQAILRYINATDFVPNRHPRKIACLSNLGVALSTRFERLGVLSDIEQAILKHRDALDLTHDGHPDKPCLLNNLGTAFNARFSRLGELSDLEQAILTYKDAVDLTPDSHPDKTGHLNNLGNALKARFDHLNEPSDLEQAMSQYFNAACAPTGSISTRFHASLLWISCARALGHQSLLHAYSVAIHILPQLAWIGLPLKERYRELVQGADVVREAAAAALDLGLVETAVEWLEQGRSIVWGELFQLRSSYEELSSAHPDHARRLRQLSVALENASATREKSLSLLSEQAEGTEDCKMVSLEEEADRHRALAIERDKLMQEIRGLPGFERFLLHKEFSQLRASAHSGPVVILNAAEHRCDALIVLADVEGVILVPLPNFPLERSTSLRTSLKGLIRYARVVSDDERAGNPIMEEHSSQWEHILSALWKCVVKPVLDSLAFASPSPGTLSRIFWCPTGPFIFLPIHAAGFYDVEYSQPGHKIFDFVVSSYVPTLSTLSPSPDLNTTPSHNISFLAVRQPYSDGLSKLPGVDIELRHIRAIINNSPETRATLLESTIGTVEEVLELMKEADWVHFACHGIQDAQNPTQSGLCLANERRLTLSDIITLSRPRGGLAFLSSCQTATGNKDLADEAIHIAAGMLFAGYGGVVGTMWSISDRLAPRVAKDVYERLFRNGARPDYRKSARALQEAVGCLRDSGASFTEWLPFIYVGL